MDKRFGESSLVEFMDTFPESQTHDTALLYLHSHGINEIATEKDSQRVAAQLKALLPEGTRSLPVMTYDYGSGVIYTAQIKRKDDDEFETTIFSHEFQLGKAAPATNKRKV